VLAHEFRGHGEALSAQGDGSIAAHQATGLDLEQLAQFGGSGSVAGPISSAARKQITSGASQTLWCSVLFPGRRTMGVQHDHSQAARWHKLTSRSARPIGWEEEERADGHANRLPCLRLRAVLRLGLPGEYGGSTVLHHAGAAAREMTAHRTGSIPVC
jgi:hypothetical protein